MTTDELAKLATAKAYEMDRLIGFKANNAFIFFRNVSPTIEAKWQAMRAEVDAMYDELVRRHGWDWLAENVHAYNA